MGRLARDGTAEPVSRDHVLRRERGQENIEGFFLCSADHEQDYFRETIFSVANGDRKTLKYIPLFELTTSKIIGNHTGRCPICYM